MWWLKINVKTGKGIWLKLNCGDWNYHRFFLLKIILERLKIPLNILPNHILILHPVMSSTVRVARVGWPGSRSLLFHFTVIII